MLKFCKKCECDREHYARGQCKECHYVSKFKKNYKGVNVKSTREEQDKFKKLADDYVAKMGVIR